MRTLLVLIFMSLAPLSAYADNPCTGNSKWPSVVSKDENATVQIWYSPEEDGTKTSYVFVRYRYCDKKVESGCVRLDGGEPSPDIYKWLRSGDDLQHAYARTFIEIRALTQGLLKYAEPLGD